MTENDVIEGLAPGGVVHNPEACTGCGLCDLMCSLYHEGEQGQALSRGELVGDRLTAEFVTMPARTGTGRYVLMRYPGPSTSTRTNAMGAGSA